MILQYTILSVLNNGPFKSDTIPSVLNNGPFKSDIILK